MDLHFAYDVIGFGVMDGQFPYEFIGFGAMDGQFPYEFIGFGAMDGQFPSDGGHELGEGEPSFEPLKKAKAKMMKDKAVDLLKCVEAVACGGVAFGDRFGINTLCKRCGKSRETWIHKSTYALTIRVRVLRNLSGLPKPIGSSKKG